MNLQQLMSKTRRALEQYKMIEDGDKIAVGLSGGKDSMALLYVLSGLRRFYPKKFELVAITVDMGLGLDENEVLAVKKVCEELGVYYHIEKTQIGEVVFDVKKESNPCSLCANMRRGALNSAAVNLGCNKVALGHHADDLIETLFLCLFYEGRFSTFSPVTHLSRANLTMIRPMIFLREMEIIGFTKDKPIIHNPCPADKNTKREYIKTALKNLEKDNKKLRENVLGAITHPERNNLFDDQISFLNEED
ncbi:MAG: tRNA 2-thiocytidine(32) synthetase TtcA [Clostridia bacterium]|nr:tRNA 2-thiocytidine(32) synthetase TtcA [Clostridia bacterium]